MFLYPPAKPAKHNKVWVDELEIPTRQENLVSFPMVVIKQHGEELENNVGNTTIDSNSEEISDIEEILGHPINRSNRI